MHGERNRKINRKEIKLDSGVIGKIVINSFSFNGMSLVRHIVADNNSQKAHERWPDFEYKWSRSSLAEKVINVLYNR